MSAVKLKEHIDFAIKRFEFVRKELDPWVGVQTCFALLLIVRHTLVNKEEMRVMDIGTLMATSSASASRNIHWLVKHKLIELYENPERRIEKFVRLTNKGKQLVKRLEGL